MGEAQGRGKRKRWALTGGTRPSWGLREGCPAEGAQSLSSGPVAKPLQCPEQAWHTEAVGGVAGGSTRCTQVHTKATGEVRDRRGPQGARFPSQ